MIRSSRTSLLTLAAFVAVYLSWQLLHWIPGSRQSIGDLLILPVDAAAMTAAWLASRRCAASKRLRLFWRLLALALAAELMGDVIQAVYDVALHRSPYPSLADPFYPRVLPIAARRLAALPVAAATSTTRFR